MSEKLDPGKAADLLETLFKNADSLLMSGPTWRPSIKALAKESGCTASDARRLLAFVTADHDGEIVRGPITMRVLRATKAVFTYKDEDEDEGEY